MTFKQYEKPTIIDMVNKFKEEGCYIGTDGHIYSNKNKLKSRMTRNGYYTIRKMINNNTVCFMEHRAIWVWYKGSIDNSLEINHIDYNKTNNKIDNLELITHQENVDHSRDNQLKSVKRGVDSPKAKLSTEDVQLIRHLKENGYSHKEVQSLFKLPNTTTISRIITSARYGSVPNASTIFAIYPLLVEKLRNKEGGIEKEISNYALGLAGEVGEVADIIKKHIYHGHELDESELVRELGDVLYYIVALCNVLNINFTEVLLNNMEKLDKRYPDGFSKEKSINRIENKIGGSGDDR